MATLSLSQKAVISQVIGFMAGNYEKPLDAGVIDRLSPMHVEFGYTSEIAFRDGLRDAPYSTLLTALLATSA